MKINWSIIGGYCLGNLSGILYMKAIEFFPSNTHQGWACVVLCFFVCLIAATFALEKS